MRVKTGPMSMSAEVLSTNSHAEAHLSTNRFAGCHSLAEFLSQDSYTAHIYALNDFRNAILYRNFRSY